MTRASTRSGRQTWPFRPAGGKSRPLCPNGRAWLPLPGAWPDITPVSVAKAVSLRQTPDGAGPDQGVVRKPVTPLRTSMNTRFVHDLFEEQASRRPHSAAVVSAGTQLTYRQLDQSANQLAHQLRGMGVGPETLVGVCLERGVEAIRCLLAILKAGGAYLPLDPSFPAARLARMCAEARPVVILASRADARTFGETDARLLLIDEWPPEPGGPADRRRPRSACTRITSRTPSTPQAPPAIPRPSPSATAPWPAPARNYPANTGFRPATGCCSWPPSALTPPSSRYS